MLKSLVTLIFDNIFFFFCCFFVFVSFIRFDAELIIFFSVFLVIFAIWNNLSSFLGKFLFVKLTLYYYYFVRYYQGRLWLVYLLNRYLSLYLFSKRLPFFIKWFFVYQDRFLSLVGNTFKKLNIRWNSLLNFYFYCVFIQTLVYLWLSFYRLNIAHYVSLTYSDLFYQENLKKVAEYVLLNKLDL